MNDSTTQPGFRVIRAIGLAIVGVCATLFYYFRKPSRGATISKVVDQMLVLRAPPALGIVILHWIGLAPFSLYSVVVYPGDFICRHLLVPSILAPVLFSGVFWGAVLSLAAGVLRGELRFRSRVDDLPLAARARVQLESDPVPRTIDVLELMSDRRPTTTAVDEVADYDCGGGSRARSSDSGAKA